MHDLYPQVKVKRREFDELYVIAPRRLEYTLHLSAQRHCSKVSKPFFILSLKKNENSTPFAGAQMRRMLVKSIYKIMVPCIY